MKKLLLVITFLALVFFSNATHIVGGYMSYTFVSGTTYHITLTVYRDCNSATQFDNPAYVAVYDGSTNSLIQTYAFFNAVVTSVDPPSNNPCLQIVTNVCVQQGVYSGDITLPDPSAGYTIVYQRCCRNGSVDNINSPGATGETYFAYVPPSLTYQNSNPVFVNFPPTYICVNSPLIFNHSAIDVDGDVLRYSLCTPYTGATSFNPAPNPPSAPPYDNITWQPPFSTYDPLGGTPLSIDSVSGVLTGTPNSIGQFVVGVCVSEYRNGQLIGTYLRDFQFNVTQCTSPVANIPSSDINPSTGIGIYTSNCSNYTVTFDNKSYNPPPANVPLVYQWDFGVPGINSDTSGQKYPAYTYPDTGSYLVRLITAKGTSSSPCIDTTFAYVKIYPSMVSDFGFKDTCYGAPVLFHDNAISTYGAVNQWTWDFGDNQSSNAQNPTHIYPAPGTYTVTLIDKNSLGCSDTSQKTVTLYTAGNSSFTYGIACAGSPVSFTPSSGGNYVWRFGIGIVNYLENPTYTFSAPGNYPVSMVSQSSKGCIDSVVKNVNVHALPTVNISKDTSICPFSSVQLSASGGTSYSWSPVNGLSVTDISDPVATPPYAPIIYSVSVTDQNQCTNHDSVRISFYSSPPINAGPDTFLCLNILNDNPDVRLYASGGVSYQWSPATDLSDANISSPIATLKSSNPVKYTVAVTAPNHCVYHDSVLISFYPSIQINAGPDTVICLNTFGGSSKVALHAVGGISYQWSPATGLSFTDISNPVATLTSSDPITYTVVVKDQHECFSSDSVVISFSDAPRIVAGPDSTVCLGSPVQLHVTGGATYQWSSTGPLSANDIPNPVANPVTSSIYYVVGADVHGCKSNDSLTIQVLALPVATVTPDTTICDQSIQLNATGGTNYTWVPSNSGLSCYTCPNPVASPGTTTKYFVRVGDSSTGCSVTDSVTLSVQNLIITQLIADSTLYSGDSIALAVSVTGGNGQFNYAWSPTEYLNDSSIANPIAYPLADIIYIVSVTSGACLDTASISIHVITLEDPIRIPSGFTPNDDRLNDEFYPVVKNNAAIIKEFRVYNRFGQLIHNSPTPWDGKFKGADQPTGTFTYYLVIQIPSFPERRYEGSVTLLR